MLGNSALDARSFSLTGQDTPKPAYNHLQGMASFGGPLKLPMAIRCDGPNFFVNYQWMRDRNAITQSGADADPRSSAPATSRRARSAGPAVQLIDPATGLPFAGQCHPAEPHQPAGRGARSKLYPLPNFTSSQLQLPGPDRQHHAPGQPAVARQQDGQQQESALRHCSPSSRRSNDGPNLFGFVDTAGVPGIDTSINWVHRFTNRMFGTSQISVQPRFAAQ